MRTQEGQITATKTKQHGEEKDTGIIYMNGGEGKGNKKRDTAKSKKDVMKKEKIVLQAVIVTWVPVYAKTSIREPYHTLCHLLPTLIHGQYFRSRPTPH